MYCLPANPQRTAAETSPSSPLSATDQAGREGAAECEVMFIQIQRGEPGWQETSYLLFHKLVHGLLLKSLGPDADVEELVGDIFVSFFENARRIRTAGAIRSYIVSIAMNRIRGEVRRRRRRSLLFRFSGVEEEALAVTGTDDPKAKAALSRLSKIVGELSANERAAFVLRSMERMPILDVADALGVSESTAKRWARRANEHVRKRVSRDALLADYVAAYETASGGEA